MPDQIRNGSQRNSRFEAVLVEIQQAEEQHRTIDQREYLERFPDLAEALRDYFRDREWFDPVADLLRPTPTATQPGMPTQLEPPPVSHFGDYAILHQVDQGGRGIVYRVSDPELHRSLAVKVLRPELLSDPDAVGRFVEEAQVTGQLQHPGIVPVHAVGRLPDGRPYFVMKLVEGRTLAQLLAVRASLAHDLPYFLAVFGQVCQAVASAHSRGVVHRDLKPKNIMVGAFAEVQVMDWGFAKVLSANGAGQGTPRGETGPLACGGPDTVRTVRTEATGRSSIKGLVMGTLAYMAPEQARGQVERLDERADVFGLGALLCEVLTGLPPYTGRTARELQLQAAGGDLAEALARLDGCGADPELIALARDCLAPERERRPRDAAAVAERLSAYLAEVQERLRRAEVEKASAQARAEEAQATVRAERRARRLTVGLAIAVLAVLVSLAVGGLWLQWQQAEEVRQAEALRRDVGAMLAQATRFRQGAHFKESRELLEQAQQRLDPDGPADLRKEVDQALADTGLARRLDAARLRALTEVESKKLDFAGAEKEYAAALKEAGLGQEGEAPGVVAARVRASAVHAEVVAALDDWAGIAGDWPRVAWLLAVARAADPNPERDRLRQPELWRDRAALARLAREARVAELSPHLVVALSRALLGSGDAIPLLRKAQAHHPNDFWLNFELGMSLNQAKQWDEAIGHYRAALALRPGVVVHTNLGLVLSKKGKLDEAISHYQQALRVEPEAAMAHHSLGVALYKKGDLDGAIQAYQAALRLKKDDPDAHNNLGAALEKKGDLDGAFKEYQAALGLKRDFPRAHNNLGNALYAKGDLDGAIKEYREALRLKKDDPDSHYNLGNALYAKGDVDGAVQEFKEALNYKKDYPKAHNNLGNALYNRGKLDEAISHYEEALHLDPNNAEAHNNLGNALSTKGWLDEAIGHYQEALRINTKYAHAHHALGRALVEKGRDDEAVDHFEHALKINPKLAQTHGALGVALLSLGRFDEARDATRRCLDLLPQSSPMRAVAMQQMQRCKIILVLKARLPAVLRGEDNPADASEGVAFGWICKVTKQYAAAVRLYTEAFTADPKQADQVEATIRYNAACCAALAAAALKPNDKDQPGLRRQALDWLRADLALWKKRAVTGNAMGRAMVQRVLWAWQNNPGLASVRDKEGLATLPDPERRAWEHFWADVEALRKQLRDTKSK
jgi:serine/threonine-protein kinase